MPHGTKGVILSRDPNLARQHPADYVKGAEVTIGKALAAAKRAVRGFRPDQVIGIGVDTTGSTPMPVDANGQPLAFRKKFRQKPGGAWPGCGRTTPAWPKRRRSPRWPRKIRPQYLAKCGGTYSSEWFFSKILHCLRDQPRGVSTPPPRGWNAPTGCPAMLTGTEAPDKLTAGVCAAGHKAMYNDDWGGYPDAEFLGAARPEAGRAARPACGARPARLTAPSAV